MITTTTKQSEISVGMGQIAVIETPCVGRTVLGSCIGLALSHPGRKLGVLAHIVLAERANRSGAPGKFADSAIPHMLQLLAKEGIGPRGLTAKLAGGANMFGGGGPIQIGEANYRAVRNLLEQHCIEVVGEHVGGGKGRRITYDPGAGTLTVEIVGEDPIVL